MAKNVVFAVIETSNADIKQKVEILEKPKETIMDDSLKSLLGLQQKLAHQLAMSSLIQVAVENANEAFLVTDSVLEDGGPTIVYVNRAFERMTGYSFKEVVGKTPRMLQGPKTDRDTLDRLKKTLKEGKPFFGRAINYRKDGSEYMLEWHISAVVDPETNETRQFVSIQRSLNDLPLLSQEDLDHLTEATK
jgi:PAS domain S-box-containing protein